MFPSESDELLSLSESWAGGQIRFQRPGLILSEYLFIFKWKVKSKVALKFT
jgi:hypothetical protein